MLSLPIRDHSERTCKNNYKVWFILFLVWYLISHYGNHCIVYLISDLLLFHTLLSTASFTSEIVWCLPRWLPQWWGRQWRWCWWWDQNTKKGNLSVRIRTRVCTYYLLDSMTFWPLVEYQMGNSQWGRWGNSICLLLITSIREGIYTLSHPENDRDLEWPGWPGWPGLKLYLFKVTQFLGQSKCTFKGTKANTWLRIP